MLLRTVSLSVFRHSNQTFQLKENPKSTKSTELVSIVQPTPSGSRTRVSLCTSDVYGESQKRVLLRRGLRTGSLSFFYGRNAKKLTPDDERSTPGDFRFHPTFWAFSASVTPAPNISVRKQRYRATTETVPVAPGPPCAEMRSD